MLNYLYDLLILAMLPGLAMLVSISPVAALHRIRMLRHKNLMYTKVDQLSLILFDVAIFIFALFFLFLSAKLSISGFTNTKHNWLALIIILVVIYLFTAALYLRRGIIKKTAELTLTDEEELKLSNSKPA